MLRARVRRAPAARERQRRRPEHPLPEHKVEVAPRRKAEVAVVEVAEGHSSLPKMERRT